jgi:hypothetical protein
VNRIIFYSDVGGSNPYELPYNPVQIDCPQARLSGAAKSKETTDGESITFYPYLDTRRGSLTWRGYPKDDSTLGVAFHTMVGVLRGYAGGYRYMNFQDIAQAYDFFESNTKVKIISVDASLRSGGSQKYDPVVLVFELAEV